MASDVKAAIKSVPLASINLSDQTYRISRPTESGFIRSLADSIKHMGMLHAPLIVEMKDCRQVVSGFRRLTACLKMNLNAVQCRVAAPDTPAKTLASLAIAENSWQRPFTLMEKARAFNLLQPWYHDPKDLALAARPLGLNENPDMIGKLILLAQLPTAIQQAVESGSLGLAMALTLGRLAPEDADKLLDLFHTFRFGLNRQRETLQLIEEVSKIESTSIGAILMSDGVIDILNRTDIDRPARGGALRRYLKRRRYPALTKKERAFNRLERELKLGPGVRLNAPPYFEGTTFQLVLSFDTLDELSAHHQRVGKMSKHPHLRQFLLK